VGPPRRGIGAAVVLLAIVGFLLVLGLTGEQDEGDGDPERATQSTQPAPRERTQPAAPEERPAQRRRNVRLEVLAARNVWVCVVDAKGNERVGGVVLAQGAREGPFRSRSFRVTIGNGGGDLRINGRRRDTPDRSEPIGYRVRGSGATVLPQAQQPTCG
jgi:hypothetical protein